MSAIVIGPYHVGEKPPQLTVTFKDSNGAAISLSGFTAKFSYRAYGGTWVTNAAAIDVDQTANKGQVHYVWVAADLAAAGDVEGEMWVGDNATQRFDSRRLAWQILPAAPTPAI